MNEILLHHLAVISTDLERSLAFYSGLFGFKQMHRPNLSTSGAWLACGAHEIHIIVHPKGSFRQSARIDHADSHFALRVDNFEAFFAKLVSLGFSEDAAEGDPKRMLVNRASPVGYPQIYLLDPDLNIIEVNAAA